MPLPEPILDDLRFQQDLVDEARRRIARYCPEWTDYNVSDPGITLIELFAWMTELLTYRLNLVPEKNHIKFMELLGVQLQPASSARTEITFRLSTLFPINPGDDTEAVVPQGLEVATRTVEGEQEAIFTTDERMVVVAPVLQQVRRDDEFNKNYQPRLGLEVFYAFSRPRPRQGDTFYLGFDDANNLAGHIVRLDFECEETQATGVRRTDPPWVWECSTGNGEWTEVAPSAFPDEQDTTGGLNNASGSITFYLPLNFQADQVRGRGAYWLRCRLEQRRREQGMYSQSPRILGITAYAMGATTRATHAVIAYDEFLGDSDGEPGQVFTLVNTPVLALREGETVTVGELRDGEMVPVPWTLVNEFSNSDRHDRHFTLDTASGEVRFGPGIRQSDGQMRQYGRIPESGRQIYFTRYRFGGGVAGNVPAGRIQVLKSAVPYIDSATNLQRAEGGRDQESLDEAKFRARREVRAQQRAVTAEDYAVLARGASRSVARVKCVTPRQLGQSAANLPPGMIDLLVVPAVADSLRNGDLSRLVLEDNLRSAIEHHLDQFRLLTTTLRVRAPNYIGIKVAAEIVVSEYSHPETVRGAVKQALTAFFSPLSLAEGDEPLDELMGPQWDGWPFGRALYTSEIYTLIQRVPGVKHVLEVRVGQRPIGLSRQLALVSAAPEADEAEDALTPVNERRMDLPADTLLCSLDHEIMLVDV